MTTRFPLNRLCREQLVRVLERCSVEETIRLVHVNKPLRSLVIDYGPWPKQVDRVRIVARTDITIDNDELFTDHLYVEVYINEKKWMFRPGALFIHDPNFPQLPRESYELPDDDDDAAMSRLIGKIRSCQQLSIALMTEWVNPWDKDLHHEGIRLMCKRFFELTPKRRISVRFHAIGTEAKSAQLSTCLPRARVVRNFSLYSESRRLSALILQALPTNVVVGNCELNLGAEEEEEARVATESLDSIGKRSLVKRCQRLILEDLKSPSIVDLLADVRPSILFLLVSTMDAYYQLIQAFMDHARRGTSIWCGDEEETHLVIYFTGPSTEMATFAEIDARVWGAGEYEAIDARSPTAWQYFDWLFYDVFEGTYSMQTEEKELYIHTPTLMGKWWFESPKFPAIAHDFEFTRRCFYRRRERALGKEFVIVNTETMCYDKKHRRIGFYMRGGPIRDPGEGYERVVTMPRLLNTFE